MNQNRKSQSFQLSAQEELIKHNLDVRKYWADKFNNVNDGNNETDNSALVVPDKWKMLKGISLYQWQEDCIKTWLEKKRGTIKVFTGAGKTILALGIIEHLQTIDKNLRVLIVVPTIVLQNQWYSEFLRLSNLPDKVIGRLGGGYDDDFANKLIVIAVLRSAAVKLPKTIDPSIADHLLLVVDECHNAGSQENRKVFNIKRVYNLGLSATPEREDYIEEDDDNEDVTFDSDYNNSLLGTELGPIIYEMTLKQAYDLGLLPRYELQHIGLSLEREEGQKYEMLSRSIKDLTSQLTDVAAIKGRGTYRGNRFIAWCQTMAKTDGDTGTLAREFIFKTGERKRLLYLAKSREEAVVKILRKEFADNPSARVILFHESIDGVMSIYLRLMNEGFEVVVENSELSQSLRETSIELFRSGMAKIIVSARSLIEGFNIPSADIGIIVASSTSVRQRIQSLGRVLRKKEGVDKKSRVYVLYIKDSTDEMIYEKTDWDKLLGFENNKYFHWDIDGEPVEVNEPPRVPLPQETEIDQESLREGEEYPGVYEGEEFSCDTDGNVFDINGRVAINPQDIPHKIEKLIGNVARFKITPLYRNVLIKVKRDEWLTLFVVKLEEEFRFEDVMDKDFDISKADLGSIVPGSFLKGQKKTLYYKKKGGQSVIASKVKNGELYARQGDKANDQVKGNDAIELIGCLRKLESNGISIRKFELTEEGHVVYLHNGQYYFITTLKSGLEFPH